MSRSQGTYEQGKVDGRVETLLRLISQRFDTPTDDVVARVRAAAPQEIDCWFDCILDAETLDELLAAPSTPGAADRRTPLVIHRDGATFELRRIRDDDLRRLGRNAAAIEADELFWLHRSVPREEWKPLSLPEYFMALSLRFGASGECFDDYKSSFAFPFRLTTSKGAMRGNYLLLLEDWKGGPLSRLWRLDSEQRANDWTFHPFVDAEFSRDDYRYVLAYLDGFLQGYLETSRPVVPDFLHTVRAALLHYGYRGGQPFEQYADDYEEFSAAVAPNASRGEVDG